MTKASKPGDAGRRSPWAGPDPMIRALTITEFCQAYRTSPSTVWRSIKDGRLKSITVSSKPHGKRLILLSSVEKGA
jgi:hypothetical protein